MPRGFGMTCDLDCRNELINFKGSQALTGNSKI